MGNVQQFKEGLQSISRDVGNAQEISKKFFRNTSVVGAIFNEVLDLEDAHLASMSKGHAYRIQNTFMVNGVVLPITYFIVRTDNEFKLLVEPTYILVAPERDDNYHRKTITIRIDSSSLERYLLTYVEQLEIMQKEGMTSRKIGHPYAVQQIECFTPPQPNVLTRHIVISERPVCSLGILMCAIPSMFILDDVVLRNILLSLFAAVDEMHKKGIVHRNLTLKSFLVFVENGRLTVKICGFEHACDQSESNHGSNGDLLAPEILRLSKVGDMWTIGMALHQYIKNVEGASVSDKFKRLYARMTQKLMFQRDSLSATSAHNMWVDFKPETDRAAVKKTCGILPNSDMLCEIMHGCLRQPSEYREDELKSLQALMKPQSAMHTMIAGVLVAKRTKRSRKHTKSSILPLPNLPVCSTPDSFSPNQPGRENCAQADATMPMSGVKKRKNNALSLLARQRQRVLTDGGTTLFGQGGGAVSAVPPLSFPVASRP